MASTTNSIGPYSFLSLDGDIDRPRQTVEAISRAGIAGNALWLTGARGLPFTLRAHVDTATLADAHAAVAAYQALIGADPVAIIKNDYAYANENPSLLFAVLNVEAIDGTPHDLAASTGGLNPPSAAYLVCAFTLLAIPQP